ncbi:MAG: hypothetical protein ACHQ9S_08820 [Candidatus Binatia bacterium]
MMAHSARQRTFGALAVAVLCLCGERGLAASNPAPVSTDVIFLMSGSNGQVGGLQMDLSWDPSCMTVERQEGDAASCASNPSTRKNVQTKIFSDNATMRVLFLSVSDTSPIADDELFSCRFNRASAPSSPCCSLSIGNLIFAAPTGGRIYDQNISIQALVGNTPCVASAPSGSPDNPVRPPLPPAAVPVAPAPIVSAPGAAPGIPGAPAPPAALPPAAGAREAVTGQAPPPGEEGAPAESATQAAATAAVPLTPTARRTPAPATATAPARTPQPQSTATVATGGSATLGSATQTPAPTAKKHSEKHSS